MTSTARARTKITAHRRPTTADGPCRTTVIAGQSFAGRTAPNYIYFWPLFTGTAIPIDSWRARMWLDTWV
ncbi:hypothetical protein E2C11_28070 [Streptomyces lavendulae]|nr:hypothetical protein E2C11_28070 [Streptomyces lavendulae]